MLNSQLYIVIITLYLLIFFELVNTLSYKKNSYDPVLDSMRRQGMFVISFMTRLEITNSWGG